MFTRKDHLRVLVLGWAIAAALLLVAPGPQPLFAGTCTTEICTNTMCHMGTVDPNDFTMGYWIEDDLF